VHVSYTRRIDKETIKKLILGVALALISSWFLLLSLKTFVSGRYGKLFIYLHSIGSVEVKNE